MSEKKIKISIGMTGINDNYQINFLNRVEFVINYTFYNLDKLNLLDNFEINFVDWGSSKPISESLSLYNIKYQDKINFHYIDKKIADNIKPNYYFNDLFIEKAMNVHLGTAEADFCMATPSDCFFNRSSLLNLYNFLRDKYSHDIDYKKAYFLVPRIVINHDFLNRNPNYQQIDRYLERLNFFSGILHPSNSYIGGGFGGQLASRQLWRDIGGNDETLKPNSSNDEEVYFRISNNYPTFNLGSYGIFNFKLENTKGSRFKKIKTFSRNPIFDLKKINKNEDLGKIQGIKILKVENIDKKNDTTKIQYLSNYVTDKNINTSYKFKEKFNLCLKSFDSDENYNDFKVTLYLIKLFEILDIFYFISLGSSSRLRLSLISQLFHGIDYYSVNFTNNNNKDLFNTHGNVARFLSNKKKNYMRFINATLESFDQNKLFKDMPSRKNSKVIYIDEKDYKFKLDEENIDDIAIIMFRQKDTVPENINENFIHQFTSDGLSIFKNKNLDLDIKFIPDDYKYIKDYCIFKITFNLIRLYRRIKNLLRMKFLFIYNK